MKITILFFALFRDRVGQNRIELEVESQASVSSLKVRLSALYPSIQPLLKNAVVSINQEFAYEEDVIPDQAEVAVFPAVSGGSDFPTIFRITNEPLNIDELLAAISLPSTGAACLFTGLVRAVTVRGEVHATQALYYEAYIPMAEAKMAQVAQEIRQRWPAVEGIAIVQRIGHLQAGTPTVLIACTASHRDTGVFEAARYGIDRLKEIVPIWKKEISPDGEEWIEGHYHPGQGD